MRGLTDFTRTDDGFTLTRNAVVAEAHVTRRDDLRGAWQGPDGSMHATRDGAYDAAQTWLDAQQGDDDEE